MFAIFQGSCQNISRDIASARSMRFRCVCTIPVVYQLNATLNLTSLGSLLNWFGIQAIRVYMKLECQTPGYHIVNWMHVIQWLF